MQEIQAQTAKLSKLESERKLAEIELKLEEERTKLRMMQVDMDVKVQFEHITKLKIM